MRFYDQPAWTVIIVLTTAASAVCDLANFVRILSARGTYRRYVAATVVHATMYPSIVSVLLLAAKTLAERDYPRFGLMLALSAVWGWVIISVRRDEDDDWFNTGGPRRLMERLSSRGRRAPAPQQRAAERARSCADSGRHAGPVGVSPRKPAGTGTGPVS